MIATCDCGKEFLTEADPYVFIPKTGKTNCGCCFEKPLQKKVAILTQQMELFARMRWGYDKVDLLKLLDDIKTRARKALAEIRKLKK